MLQQGLQEKPGPVLATLLGLVLAGCQLTPTELPVAEPSPHDSCRWELPGHTPAMTLAQVATALESEDFLVRHADPQLGLVSAERSSPTFFQSRVDPWPRLGGFVMGGSGGGFHSGVGIGIGMGTYRDDATLVERVSVLVEGKQVQISRDLRIFDWQGELGESRTGSDEAFCRSLRLALRQQLAQDQPTQAQPVQDQPLENRR